MAFVYELFVGDIERQTNFVRIFKGSSLHILRLSRWYVSMIVHLIGTSDLLPGTQRYLFSVGVRERKPPT